MLTGTFAQVNVQFSEIFELFLEIVTVHAGTWHLLSGCAPETEFCEQQQKFDIGAAVQNVRRLFMV